MCVSLKMCKKQHAIFKNNHFLIAFASHPQRRNSLSILTLHLLFFEFYSFLKNFFKNKVMLILYSAGKIDTVVLSSKKLTHRSSVVASFSQYICICVHFPIFLFLVIFYLFCLCFSFSSMQDIKIFFLRVRFSSAKNMSILLAIGGAYLEYFKDLLFK